MNYYKNEEEMNDCENSSIIDDKDIFIVEESDSVEVLPEPEKSNSQESESLIFIAGSPVDRVESLEQLGKYVEDLKTERPEKREQGSFMGFLTKAKAEREITSRGQFATYYQVPDFFDPAGDSKIKLNLVVCYLDSRRVHRHYPILKPYQTYFQLGHFDPSKTSKEPVFLSIRALLKHYTQFVYVDSFTSNGGIRVEVFPK